MLASLHVLGDMLCIYTGALKHLKSRYTTVIKLCVSPPGKDEAPLKLQPSQALETPVWWFAPFLDHSSFGNEATQTMMAMAQADYFHTDKLKIGLLQVSQS